VTPAAHNPPAIWLRVSRRREAVEVHYSFDGAAYTLLRLAYLPPSAACDAGLMCASPDGSGFQVVFEGLEVNSL
jgi:regulation of enolase protein 1 (concanavalin A-like superfamily)